MRQSDDHFHLLKAISIGLVIIALILIVVKISPNHRSGSTSTDIEKLSPAEVLREIRVEKADLEREKVEIQEMIQEGQASIIGASLSNKVGIQWFTPTLNVNGVDGKPVMIGFRNDGLLSWKSQSE